MKIQIGGMSEGVYDYEFVEDPAELDLAENFIQPAVVKAKLEKTPNQLYLTVNVRTEGRFQCDRCLKDVHRSLSSHYHMYYLYETEEERGLDPMEVQIIPVGLSVIDIGDDVRQTILLSVPLKILCKEDCKGLCPYCGKDQNIEQCSCQDSIVDPRWEKLQGLKRKQMGNS